MTYLISVCATTLPKKWEFGESGDLFRSLAVGIQDSSSNDILLCSVIAVPPFVLSWETLEGLWEALLEHVLSFSVQKALCHLTQECSYP